MWSVLTLYCISSVQRVTSRGGEHSHWKVVRGCAALKTPFQDIFSSRDPLFQALFQLQRPHFDILEKMHFQDQFSLIWAKI